MAEANIPKPTYPVSMRKSGFSHKEIEDIIQSKAQAIFGNGVNTEELVQAFQIGENADGNLDRRRTSTNLIQESGAVPASPDGKTLKGPKALAPQCLKDWETDIRSEQQELFKLLFDNGMLDAEKYGCLKGVVDTLILRHDENRKCVEFCNELDKLAIAFKDKKASSYDRAAMQKMRKLCHSITYHRICTVSAFLYDILEEEGYKKWREHLWMIASFAAVLVGLDIYLNKEMDKNERVP